LRILVSNVHVSRPKLSIGTCTTAVIIQPIWSRWAHVTNLAASQMHAPVCQSQSLNTAVVIIISSSIDNLYLLKNGSIKNKEWNQ